MIRPIRNNILVKQLPKITQTSGGIFLPESFMEDSDKVEVVEVGAGTKQKPMRLKKGDIGFRVHNWGMPVEENGVTYYMMEQDAILALQN